MTSCRCRKDQMVVRLELQYTRLIS